MYHVIPTLSEGGHTSGDGSTARREQQTPLCSLEACNRLSSYIHCRVAPATIYVAILQIVFKCQVWKLGY